jgi:transcription initiation factor TFIID subunit TAF12
MSIVKVNLNFTVREILHVFQNVCQFLTLISVNIMIKIDLKGFFANCNIHITHLYLFYLFQKMLAKSGSNFSGSTASLLAASGIDARLLSQQQTAQQQQERKREDAQTQAQRQAAAKLALRKQLEKTLLQVTFLPY